jgi:CRISPR-associated protein Csa1
MYFPSDEERRLIAQRLLPEARAQGVADELRGWAWQEAPVRPVYDLPLAVYEIAGKYCPSGRDLYVRRVLGRRGTPNRGMLEGRALHALAAELVVDAKRLIYQHGAGCLEPLEALRGRPLPLPDDGLGVEGWLDLGRKLEVVRAYQVRRIVERVEGVLARQPTAGPDAIAALALPAAVELKLDGSFLGLSPHLAADAVLFAGAAVVELKFGPRRDFHRLATTGYALVLESLYDRPIDLGCVVYADVRDGRLTIERDFHIIGDELRQWFLQEREEKARLVSEELDPGLPEHCPKTCPYLTICHPATSARQRPAETVAAANPEPVATANGATPA